jgi:hypothetical protein
MAKMTLLEMTQNILSAMDAEEVSSIGDTIESQQIADEIKTTYYDNLGNFEIRSRFVPIQLEALADPTDRPNVLKIPDEVDTIEWIKYNKGTVADPDYYDVCFLSPEDFLEIIEGRVTTTGTNLITVKFNGSDAVPYQIINNAYPTYYTCFDDEYIVFDSYNASVDSTLQNSKSFAWAEVLPSWTVSDTFTPDLHSKFFPLLLAEAKSACFINYKGVSNAKEEQRARRQLVRLQNNRHRLKPQQVKAPSSGNYGRR